MKRFYKSSIAALKEMERLEIVDDIDGYVKYLEHINGVLISELMKANTPGGNFLLQRLGYKIKANDLAAVKN